MKEGYIYIGAFLVVLVLFAIRVHFAKKEENLPPQFLEIAERDGIGTAACDYIAGMTDRYAIEVYTDLCIPKVWKGVQQ